MAAVVKEPGRRSTIFHNLLSSAFFLIACTLQAFGTLNIRYGVASDYLTEESIPLAQAGGLLLMVVFGVRRHCYRCISGYQNLLLQCR